MPKDVIIEACHDDAAIVAANHKWSTINGYTLSRTISDTQLYRAFERIGGDNDPGSHCGGPPTAGIVTLLIFHKAS